MIENAPGIYNAPSVYNQGGGGGGGWFFSYATINGHRYQTVNNGKYEWLAQNLNEVFTGLTLTDSPSTYGNTECYRKGLMLTDYTQGSSDSLIGVSYKAGCRNIITSNVSGDGWRIPSKGDWNLLFASLDDPHDIFHAISLCDFYQYEGTNKTGLSIISFRDDADTNLGRPETKCFYMCRDNSPGKGDTYMVRAHFLNAAFYGWDNDNSSPTWYKTAFCRLVRDVQ